MTKITLLLFLLASTAVAQITHEKPVTDPLLTAAPGQQLAPVVASDGNSYLAAWIDSRSGINDVLYAARVDETGRLLDPTGIRIDAFPASGSSPSLLFAGDTYTLFWNEQGFSETGSTMSIHVARLDRDGHVVDPPRLLLDNAYMVPSSGSSNGTRMAFFYRRTLYLLDATAHIAATVPVPIPEAGDFFPAATASNGSDFLVIWGASAFNRLEVDAMEFDANGKPISAPMMLAPSISGGLVAAASNGTDYIVIVRDSNQYKSIRVPHATLAASALQPLGTPAGIPNETTLTWSGTNYVLAWSEFDTSVGKQVINTQRLDASGAPFDHAPFRLVQQAGSGLVSLYGVATNGRTMFFAWGAAGATFEFDIHGMAVDARDVGRTAEMLVSQSANPQTSPDFATNGRNYLAVWNESDGIYAGRVTLDGRALDGRGIRITDAAGSGAPHVAFDGEHYVVAYEKSLTQDLTVLQFERIDPDSGALLDRDGGVPVTTTRCQAPIDIASDGAGTLAVFNDCTDANPLVALRVNRAAQPVGLPVAVSPANLHVGGPSIAWSGSEWLVAFNEMKLVPCSCLISPRPLIPFPVNVLAVRLSPNLTPIDTQAIVIDATNDESDPQADPHAASSGKDFLVTWTRTATHEAKEKHVTLQGTVVDGTVFGKGSVTSTIWTGSAYASAFTTPNGAILGATIGTIDTPFFRPFVISPSGDRAKLAAVDGRVTAVYQRLAVEPLYGGVFRIFVRDALATRGHAAGR